jgi:hypothetical protein
MARTDVERPPHISGLVFITFGTMKLFNFPPLPQGMPPIPLVSQMGLAGMERRCDDCAQKGR